MRRYLLGKEKSVKQSGVRKGRRYAEALKREGIMRNRKKALDFGEAAKARPWKL